MDDHFDIARVFEISKFDIARLTCICPLNVFFGKKNILLCPCKKAVTWSCKIGISYMR